MTLLVGANSSGKSTFLRTFPLLKQSVETATSNPILWFGRYVDYGSLEEAIHSGARAADGLTLGFRLTLPATRQLPWQLTGYRFGHPHQLDVELTLVPTARHGSRVSACNLTICDKRINLAFDDDGNTTRFLVDNRSVLPSETLRLADAAILIPSLTTDALAPGERAIVYQPYMSAGPVLSGAAWLARRREHQPLQEASYASLRAISRQDISIQRLHELFGRLPLAPDAQLIASIDQNITHGRSRKPTSQRSPEKVQTLIASLWAQAVPDILRAADASLARFVASSTYMGPLRATAQRYYRAQDLSVREVDFRGENLAMFMRSLSHAEQSELSEFSEAHFGLAVQRTDEAGHVAIRVRATGSKQFVNLTDSGFGYSQMLPVIALMWSTYGRGSRTSRPNGSILIAIEQPELHLHPAHQARLADMFVSALSAPRDAESRVKLLVETHSEAIVNRVGELIREGRLAANDVQIAVFERQADTSSTTVRFAGYDEDGSLTGEWPFGFFAP